MQALPAAGADRDKPGADQVAQAGAARWRLDPRGGGQIPGGVCLPVHQPQQDGGPRRLGDSAADGGQVAVTDHHETIVEPG